MEEDVAGGFHCKAELLICSHLAGIAASESDMKLGNFQTLAGTIPLPL